MGSRICSILLGGNENSGLFSKGLCALPLLRIFLLAKIPPRYHQKVSQYNALNLEVNIQCSSSWYIIDILLHLLIPGIGPSCCTQWGIAAKMGVIWLKNVLFFHGYSTVQMHDPEFSAEKQSCYRLRCWASTWIHGNYFHPLWFFSRPSLTPMTKKIFLLLHICPWSIEYFSSSKQSPKGHVSVYVRAGQFCLNSCHAAEKKDLLLLLRSLQS